jgi:hypothetical protein
MEGALGLGVHLVEGASQTGQRFEIMSVTREKGLPSCSVREGMVTIMLSSRDR